MLGILSIGAITLTSRAGIYYLDFYDYYLSNILFSLWVLVELIFFVHVFKFTELTGAIKRYTKQETPWIVVSSLQSYWLPGLLSANIFFATIEQVLPSYVVLDFQEVLLGVLHVWLADNPIPLGYDILGIEEDMERLGVGEADFPRD